MGVMLASGHALPAGQAEQSPGAVSDVEFEKVPGGHANIVAELAPRGQ